MDEDCSIDPLNGRDGNFSLRQSKATILLEINALYYTNRRLKMVRKRPVKRREERRNRAIHLSRLIQDSIKVIIGFKEIIDCQVKTGNFPREAGDTVGVCT